MQNHKMFPFRMLGNNRGDNNAHHFKFTQRLVENKRFDNETTFKQYYGNSFTVAIDKKQLSFRHSTNKNKHAFCSSTLSTVSQPRRTSSRKNSEVRHQLRGVLQIGHNLSFLALRHLQISSSSSDAPSLIPYYDQYNSGKAVLPSGAIGGGGTSVVWFRCDLRIHDNEVIANAIEKSSFVIPLFIFDPRDFGKNSAGFEKTGPDRAKFLLECVEDLRIQLRDKGSDLIIRIGNPEIILAQIAQETGASTVYTHQEVTEEDAKLEESVVRALHREGAELKRIWGSTLYHRDDLPFSLSAMPSTYTSFRQQLQNTKVRASVSAPAQVKRLPPGVALEHGELPTLADLGLSGNFTEVQKNLHLVGGETEALNRFTTFVSEIKKRLPYESSKLQESKSAGPKGLSHLTSQKLSPWLALGCLSPRCMFEELQSQCGKQSGGKDTEVNWLVYELLWRDFFRFVTQKYAALRLNTPMPTPALV
eukprot:CAMPEP_0196586080 /NCGR_PEP_ID=MMETSP1081-20130531/53036_1 /TAXON_ID=36882 /ORGANISM="Pyramimonas amylifera, Strain CCMP720" /LENGTH=475 /DNA_ID=CAMNT_0041907837 /DNA_START=77 /DNA_END=1504 /DNA_ORIENTATION=-